MIKIIAQCALCTLLSPTLSLAAKDNPQSLKPTLGSMAAPKVPIADDPFLAGLDNLSTSGDDTYETKPPTQGQYINTPNAFDLLDAVQGDWDTDGFPDVAAIYRSADGNHADLYIYRSGNEGGASVSHALPDFFASQGVSRLTKRSATAFTMEYGNLNGRYPWIAEITFAYRDNQFVVAGYGIHSGDSFTDGSRYFCEMNLRTGAYEFYRKNNRETGEPDASGRLEPVSISLTDLQQQHSTIISLTPEICGTLSETPTN